MIGRTALQDPSVSRPHKCVTLAPSRQERGKGAVATIPTAVDGHPWRQEKCYICFAIRKQLRLKTARQLASAAVEKSIKEEQEQDCIKQDTRENNLTQDDNESTTAKSKNIGLCRVRRPQEAKQPLQNSSRKL
ncbi:uncharacterized protein K444DRAFT_700577 [Hyaloscypha bicolor E]|uniref:Uncharacterized protein n=1 Tax=Hyaloscypha bicolor E TaxID=1095630 RepID=A0A2J6SRQ5_9HELO|nr:uncharacterized protein K444DRAFT_700577 [Hyaloscypha bicolor E]PMD53461.1 hypothetical protein K444DRAFT_700577 [Hyaloscypha bicolor E]